MFHHIKGGMTVTDIAKLLNTSRHSVICYCKKYNIQWKAVYKKKKTHYRVSDYRFYQQEYYIQAIENGKTIPEMAKELVVCDSAVSRRLRMWGMDHNKNHKSDIRLYSDEWILQHYYGGMYIYDIADLLNVDVTTIYHRLRKLNVKLKGSNSVSCTEKKIANFIYNNYRGTILTNTRKIIPPLELDIYLPDIKLAVEYNGSYWHSYNKTETTKERNKHKIKNDICAEQGIQLISINDISYYEKKELWNDFLLNKLGKTKRTIHGRECIVKNVNITDAKKFYLNNHLQGCLASCKFNYGLYFNNELVSLMSFSVSRSNKKYNYELQRFCSLRLTRVHGAASKLLKYFRKNHKGSIVTYADVEYSDGALYKTLGFDLVSLVPVRYKYYKGRKIYNRMKFQKKKIEKMKNFIFDNTLTEAENMFNNGYRRLWDSGKKVYALEI